MTIETVKEKARELFSSVLGTEEGGTLSAALNQVLSDVTEYDGVPIISGMKDFSVQLHQKFDAKKRSDYQQNIATLKANFQSSLATYQVNSENQNLIMSKIEDLAKDQSKLITTLENPEDFLQKLLSPLEQTVSPVNLLKLYHDLLGTCSEYTYEIENKYSDYKEQLTEIFEDPEFTELARENTTPEEIEALEKESKLWRDALDAEFKEALQNKANELLAQLKVTLKTIKSKFSPNIYKMTMHSDQARRQEIRKFEEAAVKSIKDWCKEKLKSQNSDALQALSDKADCYVYTYVSYIRNSLTEQQLEEFMAMANVVGEEKTHEKSASSSSSSTIGFGTSGIGMFSPAPSTHTSFDGSSSRKSFRS